MDMFHRVMHTDEFEKITDGNDFPTDEGATHTDKQLLVSRMRRNFDLIVDHTKAIHAILKETSVLTAEQRTACDTEIEIARKALEHVRWCILTKAKFTNPEQFDQ